MIINFSDVSINYEEIGEGEKIVFLHGWGGDLKSFLPVARQLPYKSYLIDLPGFGQSLPPKIPWSTKEYARAIINFVEALGLSKVTLVGHSFGGKIALEVAFEKPDWLSSLILVSSAGLRLKKNISKQVREKTYKTLKNILYIFPENYRRRLLEKLRRLFGSQDYKNASGVMRKILVKSVNDDLSGNLGLIDIPTLLLWGENDTVVPPEIGSEFNNKIKNSKLVLLKNAGHFPHLENMVSFLEELKVFLSEVYNHV
ncbi:alpha/beta hydrolase [Thermosipho ferrireducens]|uniref:Alpha/beta hydrolase n=1 Tax=Thermosipho ferrireducens TaxID=2571116 RepID=A0ABX7S8Z8_9BACT|nr:alpha/beta hydrolase [Thermosipho ferrireducens]QTA38346.1 alpha/beta hydrolase [Thermosipho ferrireducens]